MKDDGTRLRRAQETQRTTAGAAKTGNRTKEQTGFELGRDSDENEFDVNALGEDGRDRALEKSALAGRRRPAIFLQRRQIGGKA